MIVIASTSRCCATRYNHQNFTGGVCFLVGSTATLVDESLDNDNVEREDCDTLKSSNQELVLGYPSTASENGSNIHNLENEHIPMSFTGIVVHHSYGLAFYLVFSDLKFFHTCQCLFCPAKYL